MPRPLVPSTIEGMTPSDALTVRYLAACPGSTARQVARAVWPDSPGWEHRSHRHDGRAGALGTGPTMRAGASLYSLRERGWVVVRYSASGQARWYCSMSGLAALGEPVDDFADEGLTT